MLLGTTYAAATLPLPADACPASLHNKLWLLRAGAAWPAPPCQAKLSAAKPSCTPRLSLSCSWLDSSTQ